jgi:hypothetical protein
VRNLIVTGIPRGGTTLAAALIDSCHNAICLSEPNHHVELLEHAPTAGDFAAALSRDFTRLRQSLMAGGGVLDRRTTGGKPVTNYFAAADDPSRRTTTYDLQWRLGADLSDGFLLAAKHNALFASALEEIAAQPAFAVLAIVRHPADVIASWNSLRLPISEGRLPAAEKFWPEMRELSASSLPLFEKQVLIFETMCERFRRLSDRIDVLRFEDMVATPERLEAVIRAEPCDRSLLGDGRRAEARQRAFVDNIEKIRGMVSRIPNTLFYYPNLG